jgi:hypothetical protein
MGIYHNYLRYSRNHAELYMSLPDLVEYADYYVLIKVPISMEEIEARINSTYYKSIDDFTQDFKLMFSNAQEYNQEDSQVWQDAEILKQVFKTALENVGQHEVDFSTQDGKRKRYEGEGHDEEELSGGLKKFKESPVEDVFGGDSEQIDDLDN